MSRFISTESGEINLDHVVRVNSLYPKGENSYAEIWYTEGSAILHTRAREHIDLDEYTAPVVPASPGFFVVGLYTDAPYEVYSRPVIAWQIQPDYAKPITGGDDQTKSCNPWGILCPSGEVDVPLERVYPSVAEFQRGESQKLERAARELTK
jgi:hypothetical protein